MTAGRTNHTAFANAKRETQAPIDMVLHCPVCGMQHIDRPDEPDAYCYTLGDGSCVSNDPRCMHQPNPEPRWDNPPHRSHLCAGCWHMWRPADVPTNGVAAIKTKGKNDSPATDPKGVGAPIRREDFAAMQATRQAAIRDALRVAAAEVLRMNYKDSGDFLADMILELKV